MSRGTRRGTIAFFAGPAWEKWDASSPRASGIGGSETCLVHLSRELARLGYEISLFVDTAEESEVEGVRYLPYAMLPEFREQVWDCFVHFRNGRALELKPKARLRLGFAQDVTLVTRPGEAKLSEELDYLLGLSEPHVRHLAAFHGLSPERVLMTANGVDPARYSKTIERIPGRVFFSSCPSRDLHRLLALSRQIAPHVPGFEIVVAYGAQTWEGMIAQGRGDLARYQATLELMRELPWVRSVGRIGQDELARLQASSSAWFYPTSFPETFCITAVEAGFAGCPILCSSVFGLATTVGDGGIALKSAPESVQFAEVFVAHAVQLLTDTRYWETWSACARARMRRFTWQAVAHQWDAFLSTGVWQTLQ